MNVIHSAASAAVSAATSKQPPAQAARAAIAAQSDLSDQPFGKLVSALARGLPLTSVQTDSTTASVGQQDS